MGKRRLALHVLRRTSGCTANKVAVQTPNKKEEREEGGDGETSFFIHAAFFLRNTNYRWSRNIGTFLIS